MTTSHIKPVDILDALQLLGENYTLSQSVWHDECNGNVAVCGLGAIACSEISIEDELDPDDCLEIWSNGTYGDTYCMGFLGGFDQMYEPLPGRDEDEVYLAGFWDGWVCATELIPECVQINTMRNINKGIH